MPTVFFTRVLPRIHLINKVFKINTHIRPQSLKLQIHTNTFELKKFVQMRVYQPTKIMSQ